MNDQIVCLLDANSIIKYYHNEPGSKIVKYLFNFSPTAQINILNLHIPEVVSVFHKLRVKGILSSDDIRDEIIDTFLADIRDHKILPYEFKERLFPQLFDNFNVSYSIPPPKKRKKYFWFLHGYAQELKEIADVNDMAMLTIMQEIQGIIGESYLVTSDGHVLDIARAMNIATLDPENITEANLPFSLDRRSISRREIRRQAICKDKETSNCLGSWHICNICCNGAKISSNKKIPLTTKVILSVRKQNSKEVDIEIEGEIVWSTEKNFGIKFTNPINVDHVR